MNNLNSSTQLMFQVVPPNSTQNATLMTAEVSKLFNPFMTIISI